mgnify:CR=1 FL=1
MELSYWELKNWFTNVDYTIVGSGIVGLHTALRLRERFPVAKILILEKGMLPQGASTKNAGFACFGSLSEIIDDLKSHSEEEVQSMLNAIHSHVHKDQQLPLNNANKLVLENKTILYFSVLLPIPDFSFSLHRISSSAQYALYLILNIFQINFDNFFGGSKSFFLFLKNYFLNLEAFQVYKFSNY